MAAPKGHDGQGGGRPKGVPNKATTMAREAIATFVDGNADRLTGWLDRIADNDPKDAFNAFMSVVEYHIPKLQRSELTGKDGGNIGINIGEATGRVREVISALTKARADSDISTPKVDK